MKVDIVFPRLPPALDGIGDHTALLAEQLAATCDVRVLTAETQPDAIPGVAIEKAFDIMSRKGVLSIPARVTDRRPDWLILQFNQFSYGRWGLNPYLPSAMERIKRDTATRIAWIAHEHFMPIERLRAVPMSLWQRAQFKRLGRIADTIFFSIDPWVRKYRTWFPNTPIVHLPVGSNIPLTATSREEARSRIGVAEGDLLLGVFGSGHPSRLLPFVEAAASRLSRRRDGVRLLYVGAAGQKVRTTVTSVPVIDVGRLSAEEVSAHIAAMDIFLAPFKRGVSSRRGSFMVGLQHGIATVSTYGKQTDEMLSAENERAFLLAADDSPESFAAYVEELSGDPALRERIGEAGRRLYDANFDWRHMAGRVLDALDPTSSRVAVESP